MKGTERPGGTGTAGGGGMGGWTRIYPQTSHTDRLRNSDRRIRFREWKQRQINADAESVTRERIGKVLNQWTRSIAKSITKSLDYV